MLPPARLSGSNPYSYYYYFYTGSKLGVIKGTSGLLVEIIQGGDKNG
jgi:hypothetical protein